MLGATSTLGASVNIPGGQGSVAANLAAGNGVARSSQVYEEAGKEGSIGKTPYVLLGLAVLYLAWAWIAQSERIRESLSPANIAANVHNILTVTIMAIIGIVGLKVATTKLAALDIPGAAWLAQIVAAA
jgi:hypothetical protein